MSNAPVGISPLPPLDWRRMPLHGRTLIEASAGTGKTWNIGLIYLRLLLERDLRAEQILVTTFTEAAAQELRERLRRRLVEAERLLVDLASKFDAGMNSQDPPFRRRPEPSDNVRLDDRLSPLKSSSGLRRNDEGEGPALTVADDSLENYLTPLCPDDNQRQRALRKIQLARTELDRAPVSTIHALCQRIQRDYPLESGAPFGNDQLFDEQQLLRECVEDFWRRLYLVGAVDPREASLMLKAGPEGLLRDLAVLNNTPDARIKAGGLDDLDQRIAALTTDEHIAELRRLVDTVALYKRSNSALRSRLGEIADALHNGDEAQLHASLSDVFEPEKLSAQESLAHAGELAGHALIQALQSLRPLLGLREIFTRGKVLAAASEFCREEMPRRARQRQVLTFSMLIDAVYRRLCGEHADAVLADRLFDAFPVALIDEFQDTDQRQFAIFDRIYRGRGALVMIGDPKQAIYSFRGGDIAAYLRASQQADQRFSLATNHRSSAALVEAFNRWYAITEGGFAHPQIRYQPVIAAGRADQEPWTVDGVQVTQPLAIHAFRGDARERKDSLAVLEALALDDCANRIAELLNDPRQRIGDERVTPGDIAVLLTTNSQIVALRARLLARGVPCVGSGRGNIFSSEVARELALILHAVVHANDDQAVRGALSTRLLGADIAQFNAWQAHPDGFERELERFDAWRTLVRHRGVLALIEALLALRATALLAQPEGERVLTDLRHLGELLAAEESSRQGLDGLYAWFVEMRQGGEDGDTDAAQERQLRIESDTRRVQLLTIHASKGLEFPLVFLPLAWRTGDRSGPRAPSVLRHHDADGRRCVDLGSADFIAHRAAHFREDLEERLRLLYVAMTRAVHGVHIYWVDRGERSDSAQFAWQWAAIDRLIVEAQQRLGLAPGEASLAPMVAALQGMRLPEPLAAHTVRYAPGTEPSARRATQTPLPDTRPFEWLHSFSGLTRHAAAAVVLEGDSAADEAAANDDEAIDFDDAGEDQRLLAVYPWRGPRFGDAVHHVLELAGPGAVWPGQRSMLSHQLAAQAIKAQGVPMDEMQERIGRLIDRARQAELGDGLRLIDVTPERRIVEFEFQFPVRQVSLARLRQLCIAHGEAEVIPANLDTARLNGMLTGFADLIVEHDGRFHVLDYKTNWLGARLQDYRGAALTAAMREHHYPLQALLYTVALHRYLRHRMDVYTAEHHLGDSRYLFVRALGLEAGLGVWRHRWPVALIEALDDAFAGAQEASA